MRLEPIRKPDPPVLCCSALQRGPASPLCPVGVWASLLISAEQLTDAPAVGGCAKRQAWLGWCMCTWPSRQHSLTHFGCMPRAKACVAVR